MVHAHEIKYERKDQITGTLHPHISTDFTLTYQHSANARHGYIVSAGTVHFIFCQEELLLVRLWMCHTLYSR